MTSFSKLLAKDVSYVDSTSRKLDIECPICLGILFEPYLSDCCGHHFCGTCTPDLKDKPCPLCKKSFSTTLDLSLQQQIELLKIYCPMEKMGCEWTGELNIIKMHEQQCLYVLVECETGCGKKIQRSLMDGHLKQHCPKRPAKCLYCSNTVPFDTVTEHMKNCPDASVSCPNRCATVLSKRKLPEHMKECPNEDVECEFAEYGCPWKKKRKMLESHMNENWRLHNSHVIKSFNKKLSCHEKAVSTLSSQVTDLKQTQVKALEDKVKQLKADTNHYEYESNTSSFHYFSRNGNSIYINHYNYDYDDDCSDDDYSDDDYSDYYSEDYIDSDDDDDFSNLKVTMRNVKFVVGEISERSLDPYDYCLCPEFYTDRPGYKMRLMVQASGDGEFRPGKYLSVFLTFVRGGYDDELRWPFRGEITIRLCSQVSGKKHYERTLPYTSETSDYYADICPDKYCSQNYGFPKFISFKDIEDNDYLDNDRLTFEITRIAYKE